MAKEKKIFISGILMEVNSFNPVLSEKKTFATWLEGKELETMRGTSMELGGVYSRLEKETDIVVIPGFFAEACTSGPLKDADFKEMAEKIFSCLRDAGPVDGVLLVMHGALQSTGEDDCEGYLASGVRNIVGEDVPVCASLDFHAMFTEKMLSMLDSASGYQTYPHIDHFETGYRAADQLVCLIRTGIKTEKIYHTIPMIMSCENSNTIDSPMAPIMKRVQTLLSRKGVIGGSIFMTQPWLDAKELNCSIVLFTEDEKTKCDLDPVARDIINTVFREREMFYPDMPAIDQALKMTSDMKKPVIFVDYGDVPNAGGGGDGTKVLQAFIKANLSEPAVVVIADRETALKAKSIGEGCTAEFQIGGDGAPGEYNERIAVVAKVLKLDDAPICHLGPAMKGFISYPGQRALLKSGNVFIIVCENVCFSHDRAMLLTLGLDPKQMGIIAMRATHSFMSCYADVMGSWIYVDTPGYSTRDHKSLPYKKCRRPIYPLDDFPTEK